MEFTKALIANSAQAVALAKSILSTPALMNTDATSGLPLFFLPLEPESYSQSASAQVSESLLITTGNDGKKFITDNVAPGSWTWQISGYIPGIPVLEPTNLYTPFVKMNTDRLKKAFRMGLPLRFKDTDCTWYDNVVIQDLTIETQADCRNRTPITVTLKEVNVLTAALANVSEVAQNATPTGAMGAAKEGGQTAGNKVENVSMLRKLVNGGAQVWDKIMG